MDDVPHTYSFTNDPIKGFATLDGTTWFSLRNPDVQRDNFKVDYTNSFKISSMTYGTYMGAPDDKTDFDMYSALKTCVFSGGINTVDTAINYRYQKSERTIGKALRTLIQKYGYSRDEFIICTKGGYVPEDADEGYPGRILL